MSDASLAVAPNSLAREFQVHQPDRVWAADLTYLWTQEGWLYLPVVLDLCSRRIVGWSLGTALSTKLPLRALHTALGQRSAASSFLKDKPFPYPVLLDPEDKVSSKLGVVALLT